MRRTIKIMSSKPEFFIRFFLNALLFVFLIFGTITPALAQLKLFPIHSNPALTKEQPRSDSRTQQLPAMSVPFFDDFSQPFIGSDNALYPDPDRWEDSYSVWINPGLGITAPTVNV